MPLFDLESLLCEQNRNLVDFTHAFERLTTAIDVIDPAASRNIALFLSGKKNIIQLLIANLGAYRFETTIAFSSTAEMQLIDVYEEAKAEGRAQLKDSANSLIKVPEAEVINVRGGIPTKQVKVLETYLAERKPRTELAELEKTLKELHATISKHFKIEDVLLKVGDARLARDKWPASWPRY